MWQRFSTRLTRVDPEPIRLTVENGARVRVVGRVFGYVRCGGQLRWAFGDFEHSFRVTPGPGAVLLLRGLLGTVRKPLAPGKTLDVRAPSFPLRSFQQRALHPQEAATRITGAPAIARVEFGPYASPRIPTLSREVLPTVQPSPDDVTSL